MIEKISMSKFGFAQRPEQPAPAASSRTVIKPEKVCLCRECYGTGRVTKLGLSRKCPNCDGSGRVLVSCEMKLHIRPYKESK